MRGSGPSHSLRAQRAESQKAGIRPVPLRFAPSRRRRLGGRPAYWPAAQTLGFHCKLQGPEPQNARFGAFLWGLARAQTSVIFSAGLKWPRGWPQTGQNSGGSVPSCTRPQTVQIQRMGCALR